MSVNAVFAALLVAAAVLLAAGSSPLTARERLDGLGVTRSRPAGGVAARQGLAPSRLAAVIAGSALFLLVGGVPGAGAGVLAAVLTSRWLAGLEPRSVRLRRQRIQAELPVAADLLAACLLAGCPPLDAAAAVAGALGGPLGEEVRGVVATLRLGGDPSSSWLRLARQPELEPLARSWARALDTGAPLADAMSRLAQEQRAANRLAAESTARRAGVRATAPLGICFLPAFVLIGVVPAIAGIATELFP